MNKQGYNSSTSTYKQLNLTSIFHSACFRHAFSGFLQVFTDTCRVRISVASLLIIVQQLCHAKRGKEALYEARGTCGHFDENCTINWGSLLPCGYFYMKGHTKLLIWSKTAAQIYIPSRTRRTWNLCYVGINFVTVEIHQHMQLIHTDVSQTVEEALFTSLVQKQPTQNLARVFLECVVDIHHLNFCSLVLVIDVWSLYCISFNEAKNGLLNSATLWWGCVTFNHTAFFFPQKPYFYLSDNLNSFQSN